MIGMSANPLSIVDINAWMTMSMIDVEEKSDFLHLLQMMDEIWLKWNRSKQSDGRITS